MSEPRRILCAWCSQYFDWTPGLNANPAPTYCSKTHKSAAYRASKRMRTHMVPGRCPTPDKRGFDTAGAAQRWMQSYPERSGGGGRAYLCACGQHHIGRVKRHVHAAGVDPSDWSNG